MEIRFVLPESTAHVSGDFVTNLAVRFANSTLLHPVYRALRAAKSAKPREFRGSFARFPSPVPASTYFEESVDFVRAFADVIDSQFAAAFE
ncbi:hypothetical protein [Paraburkholderia dokdonensis]|uniref:hypothetical protein n=1 Tax=Paraburkholderia dokdonensis TaxID=2211211 RepID=UPI001019FE1E|nr:hypothetical protein [Paraburkholderia dokdonensis]